VARKTLRKVDLQFADGQVAHARGCTRAGGR
jgi:hypothetical protein